MVLSLIVLMVCGYLVVGECEETRKKSKRVSNQPVLRLEALARLDHELHPLRLPARVGLDSTIVMYF